MASSNIHYMYRRISRYSIQYILYILFLHLLDTFVSFLSELQNLYANAIYDNIAETPEELAFKRGDLLLSSNKTQMVLMVGGCAHYVDDR